MWATRYLVGFTGHRAGFDRDAVRTNLSHVLQDLLRRATSVRGELHLWTSIAEGADTLCVQLARELDIPVRLLLPLEEQEFSNDFSPLGWAQAAEQLAIARSNPDRDSVRLAGGSAPRPECYLNQAMEMLRGVHVLVAVTDGQPSRGPGGTGSVLDLAAAMGLPVISIDAATGAVTSPPALDAVFAPAAALGADRDWPLSPP
jgi:hypothetical protein